jgi:hypothetical protein
LWTFRERAVDNLGNLIPGQNEMPTDPKAAGLFKDAVWLALGLLKNSRDADVRARAITLREPAQVWLDLMRENKRGFRRILKPRTASEYRRILEAENLIDVSGVPLGVDGSISDVFAESADFWDHLVHILELAPHLAAEQGVPGSPNRTKREPHPNPEAILAGKNRITARKTAELLGVSERRVRALVLENDLRAVGKGHAKQISVDSVRRLLSLSTNSEESGNPRK